MPPDQLKLQSALLTGWVRHRRFGPTPHAFRFPLCMLYLDLGEIERVFDHRLLWSSRRPAPIRFRREDYLVNDDPCEPLESSVRQRVFQHTGAWTRGPIRVLTIPRTLGVSFNPVSLYYCFDRDGHTLDAVVAEITNTPWMERHAYVLSARDGSTPDAQATVQHSFHRSFDKRFHVSPFMPMRQQYTWSFNTPPDQTGGRLGVSMRSYDDNGTKVFDATLGLKRRPITPGTRALAAFGYPAMNLQVLGGIYAHAGLLHLKKTPFYRHPRLTTPTPTEDTR